MSGGQTALTCVRAPGLLVFCVCVCVLGFPLSAPSVGLTLVQFIRESVNDPNSSRTSLTPHLSIYTFPPSFK